MYPPSSTRKTLYLRFTKACVFFRVNTYSTIFRGQIRLQIDVSHSTEFSLSMFKLVLDELIFHYKKKTIVYDGNDHKDQNLLTPPFECQLLIQVVQYDLPLFTIL